MNPLKELSWIVNNNNSLVYGKVTAKQNTTLLIATPNGLVRLEDTLLSTSVGDTVKLKNGLLSGKVKGIENLPKYYV